MKIVVKNKWTYLWLLLPVCAVIKLAFYDAQFVQINFMEFILQLLITAFIALIGWYFFIKFNTRSRYLNPDHPKK